MDNAVYTFEQLLQQSLDAQGQEDMCKAIQRCQDRVLKVRSQWKIETQKDSGVDQQMAGWIWLSKDL